MIAIAMSVNLSSIVWALLVALFVDHYLSRWVNRAFAICERERTVDAREMAPGPGSAMPDDLTAFVNTLSTGASEADDILRQQTAALLYEKAAEFNGDWDKVRAWATVNISTV